MKEFFKNPLVAGGIGVLIALIVTDLWNTQQKGDNAEVERIAAPVYTAMSRTDSGKPVKAELTEIKSIAKEKQVTVGFIREAVEALSEE